MFKNDMKISIHDEVVRTPRSRFRPVLGSSRRPKSDVKHKKYLAMSGVFKITLERFGCHLGPTERVKRDSFGGTIGGRLGDPAGQGLG